MISLPGGSVRSEHIDSTAAVNGVDTGVSELELSFVQLGAVNKRSQCVEGHAKQRSDSVCRPLYSFPTAHAKISIPFRGQEVVGNVNGETDESSVIDKAKLTPEM